MHHPITIRVDTPREERRAVPYTSAPAPRLWVVTFATELAALLFLFFIFLALWVITPA